MRKRNKRRKKCGVALAVMTACATGNVFAGFVEKGSFVRVEGPDSQPESWYVSERGWLALGGARAKEVVAYGAGVTFEGASVAGTAGPGLYGVPGLLASITSSLVESSERSAVTLVAPVTADERSKRSRLTVDDSKLRGKVAALDLDGDGVATFSGSSLESVGDGSAALILRKGAATISQRSIVHGVDNALRFSPAFSEGGVDGGRVDVSNSTLSSDKGAAISVEGQFGTFIEADVRIKEKSTVASATGRAVHVGRNGVLDLFVSASSVEGSIDITQGSDARANFSDNATFRGSTFGSVDLSLSSGSHWLIDQSSDVRSLDLSGGSMAFTTDGGAGRVVHVRGDLSGAGGDVRLNAFLSSDASVADQIVVDGDLRTASPLLIYLAASGIGGVTDINGDGQADRGEGLSLVRVNGSASEDQVQLAGGYVVAGPYQYAMHAWRPTDDGSATGWDYRLASRMVVEGGSDESSADPGDHTGEGAGPGDDRKDAGRPAVAPEIPAYLSMTAASLSFTDSLSDGLHQRMGELRDSDFSGDVGTEWFVRQRQARERYTSNRPFSQYGYDFDQRAEYIQFGGSLVALDGDNGALRAGWAVDHGTTVVTPRAVDGYSVTRLKSNGVAAWLTWKLGSSVWIDAVAASHNLRGGTDTALGGRATGAQALRVSSLSAELGFPIALSQTWILEPRLLAAHRSVSTKRIVGHDGLSVDAAQGNYGRYAAGLSFLRNDDKFAPYLRLSAEVSEGDGVALNARAGQVQARFVSGAPGASYGASGGFTVRVGDRLRMYGETTYRHYLGRSGMQGWSTNMGLRMAF